MQKTDDTRIELLGETKSKELEAKKKRQVKNG